MPHPKRDVLLVPLDEVIKHLANNERQDVKVIAPSILTPALYEILAKKKKVKQEELLAGERWESSDLTEPNKLCESADFEFGSGDPDSTMGPLAVSFANEKAEQEEHFHVRHAEAYFSEHGISGHYRRVGDIQNKPISLPYGGLVLFGPEVVHHMKLDGITIVMEFPAVEKDRFLNENGPSSKYGEPHG